MSQLSKNKHTKKTCLLIAGVSFLFSSCSLDVTKLQEFQCDTFFTYIVYEDHGIAATLKEKVDQLENIFSPYKEGTELYRLNKDRSGTFSNELVECLKEAITIQEETDGYYNPFMGKLCKEWMLFINEKRDDPLSDEEINTHLTEINSTSVSFEGNKITLNGDADIDLSGICKGYIIDTLYEMIKDKTEYYLVNAGSSSVLLGKKMNRSDDYFYTVSFLGGEYTLLAKDTTLSTSGVNEQYRIHSDGHMYSHLINPKTGSARVFTTREAVLLGRDGSKGDALATAFMFMNDEDRLSVANKEDFKYAIYDYSSTFKGWSYMSPGLNIEPKKTNK